MGWRYIPDYFFKVSLQRCMLMQLRLFLILCRRCSSHQLRRRSCDENSTQHILDGLPSNSSNSVRVNTSYSVWSKSQIYLYLFQVISNKIFSTFYTGFQIGGCMKSKYKALETSFVKMYGNMGRFWETNLSLSCVRAIMRCLFSTMRSACSTSHNCSALLEDGADHFKGAILHPNSHSTMLFISWTPFTGIMVRPWLDSLTIALHI